MKVERARGRIRTSKLTGTVRVVSGGYANVMPNSKLSINAVEAYPLEDFSAEAIRSQTAEAQKVANGGGSEQDIAEAKIELEVRFRTLTRAVRELLLTVFLGSRDFGPPCEVDGGCGGGRSCTSTFLFVVALSRENRYTDHGAAIWSCTAECASTVVLPCVR